MASNTKGSLSDNSLINGLFFDGWRWDFGSGPHNLFYYFSDTYAHKVGNTTTTFTNAWTDTAINGPNARNAYETALAQWAAPADLTVLPTATASEADLKEALLTRAQMDAIRPNQNAYAFHEYPDTRPADGGYSVVYPGGTTVWGNDDLRPGGLGYFIFLHEQGHALGFKHPFDTAESAPLFPGVTAGDSGALGDNQLSHMFSTVMAYNTHYTFDINGEIERGTDNPTQSGGANLYDYGYASGPMALDIAAIQLLYGASETFSPTDDTYILPDLNQVGTRWYCLWDTGGIDEIVYNGSRGVNIDLAPATLDNSPTGGGALNYADNVRGGFTIAGDIRGVIPDVNGVTGVIIENARGDAGNDVIRGNDAANILEGRGGWDNIQGRRGNDHLSGGAEGDTLEGNEGDDTLKGGGGVDFLIGGEGFDTASYADAPSGVNVDLSNRAGLWGDAQGDVLSGVEDLDGSIHADQLTGDGGANRLFGDGGNDTLKGSGGADQLLGGGGIDTAVYSTSNTAVSIDLAANTAQGGHANGDVLSDIENIVGSGFGDSLSGDNDDNRLVGGNGNDTLKGAGGSDVLEGGLGSDHLTGGAGNDTLQGGEGSDTASFAAALAGITVYVGVHQVGDQIDLNGSASGADIGSDALIGMENVIGGSGNDSLFGDGRDNVFAGGGGSDTIEGGGGSDTADYSAAITGMTIFTGPHQTGPGQASLTGRATGGGLGTDILTEVENIIGGSGADTITGDSRGNRFVGGLGSDTMEGGTGNDAVDYSATTAGVVVYLGPHQIDLNQSSSTGRATGSGIGTDILTGFEIIIGGSGNDDLHGDAGPNTIAGGAGRDTLSGGNGFDFLDYSSAPGAVTVDLGPTTAQSTGGAGVDTVTGFEGIIGSRFGDVLLRGFATSVSLVGGLGNDLFHDHNSGADTFDGGDGQDRVDYATGGADAVTVDLAAGRATSVGGSVNVLVSIEDVGGSEGNDTLLGDGLANNLEGRGGHDVLGGGGGLNGINTLSGGAGFDTVTHVGASGPVLVDLRSQTGRIGGVLTDLMNSIENATGGSGNDILIGDASVNVLSGAAGSDVLYGFGGNDVLLGGGVTAGGRNQLWGGDGEDTASYQDQGASFYVDLRSQAGYLKSGSQLVLTDTMSSIEHATGGSGTDTLIGTNVTNLLRGGAGNDALYGLGGNDILQGGAGNDQLWGGDGLDWADYSDQTLAVAVNLAAGSASGSGAGTDTFSSIENARGGAGLDTIRGSTGANLIEGGGGRDILYGLAGADTFIYRLASDSRLAGGGYDTIADFSKGTDKLNLAVFGITAAKVSIQSSASATSLYADVDGVAGFGSNDLAIAFMTANAITTADIIF